METLPVLCWSSCNGSLKEFTADRDAELRLHRLSVAAGGELVLRGALRTRQRRRALPARVDRDGVTDADLGGADLGGAVGLTSGQLSHAHVNRGTRLPQGLSPSAPSPSRSR
jgi:hypothetical protein